MKHHSLRAVLVAVAPLAFAGSLAGYSPIGCGCEEVWEALAANLEMPITDSTSLTPGAVQKAMDRQLRGTKIDFLQFPLAFVPEDCQPESKTALRCTYWLWHKGASLKGLQVTIKTVPDKLYRSVRVVEVEK